MARVLSAMLGGDARWQWGAGKISGRVEPRRQNIQGNERSASQRHLPSADVRLCQLDHLAVRDSAKDVDDSRSAVEVATFEG